jgi:hypothetical protein
MELVDNKTSLLEEITALTSLDQFIETIFVDEKNGVLEIDQTIKVGDELINSSKKIDYNLKSTRLTIKSCKILEGKVMISDISKHNSIYKGNSNCELINKNINSIFSVEFSELKKLKNENFPFFKQSIIKKIFNPNTKSKLINKINSISKDKGWVLIPESLVSIVCESENFESYANITKHLIYSIGKLNGCSVYVNSDENSKIYFGNYDSITLLIDKSMKVENVKSTQDLFQDTKRITIYYQFIQNEEISCLNIA